MSRWIPTSGRGRALLFVGLALLVSGALWWRLAGYSGEPSYGGRPLSYWLDTELEQYVDESGIKRFRLNAESAAAVRGIGTNAFPKLREWMIAPERGWRTRVYVWILQRRFPDTVRSLAYLLSGYYRYHPAQSILALQALGGEAEGAIPFLIEMLMKRENLPTPVHALSVIRPKGVDALVETFPRIADENVRAAIMSSLEKVVTSDLEPAFASFAAKWAVDDRSDWVRWNSVNQLGRLTNSAAVAVPTLINALSDRERNVRAIACKSLGQFGKAAASAAAPLRSALNDSYPLVRQDAARALQAIGAPPVE